jgi:heme exporter protein D
MLSGSLIACPVCFDAKDGTREAFVWTTVMLSLVPLAMIFGGGYLLRKRFIAMDAQQEATER